MIIDITIRHSTKKGVQSTHTIYVAHPALDKVLISCYSGFHDRLQKIYWQRKAHRFFDFNLNGILEIRLICFGETIG